MAWNFRLESCRLIVLVTSILFAAATDIQSCDQEDACNPQDDAISLLQTALSHSSTKMATAQSGVFVNVAYVTSMNSTGPGDKGLMASFLSASRHMPRPGNLIIHLITPAKDRPLAEKFIQCFQKQFKGGESPTIHLYDLRPVRIDIGKSNHAGHLQGVSETYVRWYLGEYLANVSRVIYLDTDTIVQDDLTNFYGIDLEDQQIIAAKHAFYTLGENYKESIDVIPYTIRNASVIQAGILLMDLDRWRDEKVLDVLETTANWVRQANHGAVDDQLVLSLVFNTKFKSKPLDYRWNNEAPGFLGPCDVTVREAAILHWTGPFKAWNYPHSYQCHSFLRHTPMVECPA
jgi:hypothetical protein